MARANSSKNKDKKKKKTADEKKSKSLKALKSDQKKKSEPVSKSLTSLKKIQTQLDDLVIKRKKETKFLNELGQHTQSLNEQFKAVESRFPKLALNEDLQQIKANLKKKSTKFKKNTAKLAQEISLFKNLTARVEHKIQVLESQTKPDAQQFHGLEQNQTHLFEKISHFENELSQIAAKSTQSEQSAAEFTEELIQLTQVITKINQNHQAYDTQIKLLQTDAGTIKKSIQALNQDDVEQQKVFADDREKLSGLTARVNQFDDILQQSQNELKQHIQLLIEPDKNENLQQFNQIRNKLEQFSQKLGDAADQSRTLQALFSDMQEQQIIAAKHHDEWSKQYLNQQQQLQHHDTQLEHLNPLLEKNNAYEQQFRQVTKSLKQLTSVQYILSDNDKKLQSRLTTLAHKLKKSHFVNQQKINELESLQLEQKRLHLEQKSLQLEQNSLQREQSGLQQDQTARLDQLGEKIKSHRQLFITGLIAVLAVSILLLFKDEFNQDALQSDTEKQAAMTQIKSEIRNETFSEINALTKQNSTIINKQLNQIRTSIQQIKENSQKNEPMDFQSLQNDWQAQQQLLQEDVLEIQTEQQTQNQSVSKLENNINTLSEEFQQLQKTVIQKSESSTDGKESSTKGKESSTATNLAEITDIKTISEPFYTIQLLGALKKDSVGYFLEHNNVSEKTELYQTSLQGKPWYIVVHGRYSSYSQAGKQLQQLPESLLKHHPWVRKLP